nr:MAG TPA: tail tape measure [Caudoviricetes sp.]
MSKSIDERVVEMQFDNQQFEKGINTSVKSLDKLKKSLQLDDAGRSFEKLERSAKNVRLDGLAASVDAISSKFTLMGRMSIAWMDNIANAAVNAGKRIVNALTVDPVRSGFNEYELKMDSVKTIMNGSKRSLEDVTKALDELNKYADDTIYSFSDMTSNIGKFVNNNVELEDAVAAMKGISNAAALAGQGATQASSAMYNFSQSLSSFLNTRDWLSIENANMATYDMRKAFLDTAVEVGTLQKVTEDLYKTIDGKHEVTVGGFRDTLQYQWGTKDVIIKTLKKYSDTTTELGQKATEAATQVRTLSKMWDALKEAAQSGWGQTWEIVFGNIDEATKLFTGMSEAISEVLEKQTKTRNEVLQTWKDLGGRDSIINAVANSFNSLRAVLGEVKQAFFNIEPKSMGEKLAALSKKIETVSQNLLTWLWSENKYDNDWPILAGIRRSIGGIKSVFGIVLDLFKALGSGFTKLFPKLIPSFDSLVASGAKVGDWLKNLRKSIQDGKYFENFTQSLVDMVKPLVDYMPTLWDHVKTLFSGLGGVLEKYKVKETLKGAFTAITNFLPKAGEAIWRFGKNAVETVRNSEAFQKIVGVFQKIGAGIADGFGKFVDSLQDFDPNDVGTWLKNTFTSVKDSVANGLANAFDFLFGGGAWEKLKNSKAAAWITNAIHTIGDALSKAFNWLKTTLAGIDLSGIKAWFSDTFGGISDSLDEKGQALKKTGQNVGDWIKNFVSKISPTRIILFGTALLSLFSILKLVLSITSLISGAGKLVKKLAGLNFKSIVKKMFGKKDDGESFSDKCKGFALAVGVLAGAIYVISKLPVTDAWRAVAILSTMMIGMYAVTFAMDKLTNANTGTTILKFSGGIALLAYAIKMLANMKDLEKAGEAIQQLLDFLANVEVLGLLSGGIRKLFGITGGLSTDILSLGGGLLAMVFAIKAFSAMKLETITSALPKMMLVIGALGLMMDILTAVGQHMLGLDPAKGTMKIKGLVSMAVALTILMIPLKVIAGMTSKEFQQGMEGLLGLMTFMSILAGVAGWAEFKFSNGAGFLALSAAILLLVPALLALSLIPAGQLASASLGMAAITAAMSVLAKTAKKMKKLGFKGIISMLAVAVAASEMMWVFAESLSKVGDMDWKTIAAFSVGLSVAILAITGAVSILGKLDIGTILKGCVGLIAIAASLGVATSLLLKIAGGGIVDFSRDLLLIGGNLGEFSNRVKDLDPDKVSLVGDAVSSLAKVFGANYFKSLSSSAILSMTGKATLVASDLNEFCRRLTSYDAQKIENACGSITIISDTLADVTDNSSTVEGFASSLTSVGGGLQNFMSSIAGYGIVGAVKVQNARKTMDSIHDLAVSMQETTGIAETINDVSVATTNLGSAIDLYSKMAGGLSEVDGTNVDPSAVGTGIAAMMRALVEELPDDTTIRQIESYAGNGETGGNMTKFALGLNSIATAMSSYGEECKNLNLVPVMLGNMVLDQVAKIPDKLGKEGGLLQWFTGQTASLSTFATNLASVGTGLGNFVQGTTGITSEGITVAGQALDMLIDRQDKLNTTSNFWTTLTGTSLGDFSTNFTRLGDGLKGFYNAVNGIRGFNTVGSFLVLDALIKRQGSLNQLAQIKRGFDSWDLDLFSSQFANLGLNLSSMYSNIEGIDTSKAQDVVSMIQDFINMEKDLAKIGSKGSLEDFGGRIGTLGTNLESFSTSLTNFTPDMENLSSLFVIMNKFIALQGQLNDITASSDKMVSFSSVLTQTSDYINSFAGTGGISTGNVQVFEQAASGIEHIARAIQSASGLSYGDGSNLIDVIQGFIEAQTFDKWTLAGSDLISNMLKGMATEFENGWISLNTSVTTLMDNVIVAVTGYESDFVTSGRNFTYGVARGIGDSGAVQSAVSAAVSVARKALSALNSALDEHSPSKETTKSGQFFTEGFVQGISKTADGAADAAASVAEEIIEGFNGTLGIHSESTVAYQSAQWWNRGFRHAMKDERMKTVDEAKKTSDEISKVSDPERNGLVKAFEKGAKTIGKVIEDVTKKTGTTFKDWNLDTVTDMFGKYEELGSNGLEDYLNRVGASAEEKKFAEYLRIYGKAALEKLGLGGLLEKGDTSKIDDAIKNSGSGVSKAAVDMAKISSIFDAIAKIGSSVDLLGSKVSSMQIVMDSGELVGSIENKIDSRLGTLTALRGRGV